MPKVSVVIPVYNGKDFVALAMASVLKQHDVDLELIVCNDGSTDNTLQIVNAIASQDARVRVLTRLNSGRPCFPKNDGIQLARGDYLCFLDHAKKTLVIVCSGHHLDVGGPVYFGEF